MADTTDDDIWSGRGERRGVALSVRLPKETHQYIVTTAKAADRSLTQETAQSFKSRSWSRRP